MDFVWIYAEKFSYFKKSGLFNELDYSIRSVRKNFRGAAQCYVVGDKPDLDVRHIKAPPLVTHEPITGEPVNLDLLNKLDAIRDSEVNDNYVLMYDDTFFLKPTTRDDLDKCYGMGEVINPSTYIQTRRGGKPFKRLWVSTYDYLVPWRLTKGLKTYDWETHVPRFLNKQKMDDIIKGLYLRDIPKIPTSIYSAYHYVTTELVTEELLCLVWTHFPNMDFDRVFNAQFLNICDDVIVPEFIERMYEYFGR